MSVTTVIKKMILKMFKEEFSGTFEHWHFYVFLRRPFHILCLVFFRVFFTFFNLKAFLKDLNPFQSFTLKIFSTVCHLPSIIYGILLKCQWFKILHSQIFNFPSMKFVLCFKRSSNFKPNEYSYFILIILLFEKLLLL